MYVTHIKKGSDMRPSSPLHPSAILLLVPLLASPLHAAVVSASEVFHFSSGPQSVGTPVGGSSANSGASFAETEATYTGGNGSPAGLGYVHSTAQSIDGLAPSLHVYTQAQGQTGTDWILSATNAVLNDSLTLSGTDAPNVASYSASVNVHALFTGNSSGNTVVVSFSAGSSSANLFAHQGGDYLVAGNSAVLTSQPLSLSLQLLVQSVGFAAPDATHSNFSSIDATIANRYTPNPDGSFTEAGPVQFSFRDANGNPLTNVTVTGASGFSYTATTLAVPEPASLALLAPILLLALRRRARPAF
jgi:hypothetical protein